MKLFLVSIILFLVAGIAFPQVSDSTQQFNKDSLLAGSGLKSFKDDTTKQEKKYDVDTVIYASSSDSLIFNIKNRKMDIYGNSELKYKTTDLKSEKMFIDFKTNQIDAEGEKSDTLEGKLKGAPVLTEGGESFSGTSMRYNFKTNQGFISYANTESEGAYYSGEKIKKVSKHSYFVEDGTFTTCDAKPPHYYFFANKMKVIEKQEIDAKWIFMFFGGVPFPIPLPFGVFPLQSGRRSGIIAPAFGDDGTYGKYFNHFGYFFAFNDYLDLNLTADYYTRGSYRLNSRFRYVKRYDYNGNFQAGYAFFKSGLITDPDRQESKNWQLMWQHHQNFTPTLTFDANLDFTTKNFIQRNSADINQQLTNTIVSNATLFKSWEESGNSLSLSYSRTQYLESGNINESLPNLTFSKNRAYPFRTSNNPADYKWYDLIGYSYTGQFQNNRVKTNGQLKIRGGIQHNFVISASPKIGYFNIVPSVNYNERWYNKKVKISDIVSPYTGNDSVIVNDVKQINFVRTFNVGLSASTKFYGIFQPNIFGIAAIRHTVNPSISYNFTPDFSKPFWGYYDSYRTPEGNIVQYNKFQREIFGGPSSGESQSISLSINNIFEMKTAADPTDTTSKVNKIQLLRLNAGMGYNFAADSLKLSDLSLSYSTQVGNVFSLQGSSSFTPYDYSSTVSKINKFLINEGKGLLRMTNFSFSVSTTLSGEKLKSSKNENTYQADTLQDNRGTGYVNDIYTGIYGNKEADFSIPWNISLSYIYSISKPIPSQTFKSSNLSGSLDFNLTPNWKLSFTGSYDLEQKEFAAPQIKISRDLHAWILNFTWNPIGTFRGYFLEIRIKAPQLSDFKITKRDQFYNGR